ELARPHLGRLAAALAREDRVERKEEKDEDGPEKERLVRLSHLTLLRNGLAGRNGSKSGDASLLARERLAQGIHFRAEFEPYRVGRRRGASGARGEPLDPEDAACGVRQDRDAVAARGGHSGGLPDVPQLPLPASSEPEPVAGEPLAQRPGKWRQPGIDELRT